MLNVAILLYIEYFISLDEFFVVRNLEKILFKNSRTKTNHKFSWFIYAIKIYNESVIGVN